MAAHTSVKRNQDKEVCIPNIDLPVAPEPYVVDERKYLYSLNIIRYGKNTF